MISDATAGYSAPHPLSRSEIVDDGSLEAQPDGVGRIVDQIADDALVESDVVGAAVVNQKTS